jgi:PAS domain S-box-containing protein
VRATHLGRAAYTAFGPPPSDALSLAGVHGALFSLICLEVLLLPMGFMLLADERVVAHLKDSSDRALKAELEASRRREAEMVVRESERRFRTLADAAPVMIWVSDADMRCTYVNRPWLEFTGRSIDAELGEGWTDLVHRDDLARCLEIARRAFDARQRFQAEFRLRRHDAVCRLSMGLGHRCARQPSITPSDMPTPPMSPSHSTRRRTRFTSPSAIAVSASMPKR